MSRTLNETKFRSEGEVQGWEELPLKVMTNIHKGDHWKFLEIVQKKLESRFVDMAGLHFRF